MNHCVQCVALVVLMSSGTAGAGSLSDPGGVNSLTAASETSSGLLVESEAFSAGASEAQSDAVPTSSATSSFSATYQLTHEASRSLLESVRVQTAVHGVSVHQLLGTSGAGIVLNADVGQMWLVDGQRQIYHKVPIVEVPDDASGSVALSADPTDLPSPMTNRVALKTAEFMPFIQFSPCIDMDGMMTSEIVIHGKRVQLWECSVSGQLLERQWFDVELSLVVKGLSEEGYISEFLDIRQAPLSTEHFYPPEGYRQVTVNEFMGVDKPISRYNE